MSILTTGGGQTWGSKSKGTALFKLKEERPDLFSELQVVKIRQRPPGFREVPGQDGWFFHPEQEVYFDSATGKRFGLDAGEYYPVRAGENKDSEISFVVEASTFSDVKGAPACRKVFVLDLHKTALAMKLDVTHHDRPAAVLAVFSSAGAGPEAGPTVEAAAKGFHMQLLPRLAGFRGEWTSERLEASMLDSVRRAAGGDEAASAVSVSAALLLGTRLTAVAVGEGARCLLSSRRPESEGPGTVAIPAGGAPAPGSSQSLTSATACLDAADGRFQSLTLVAGAAGPPMAALTDDAVAAVAETAVARRRPKAGCGLAIEAARAVDMKGPLIVAMARLDWAEAAADAAPPPAKRPRLGQVRVRHILLKHIGSAVALDKARNRKVKRSLQEAEGAMLKLLGELDADPSQFTAKCRERSECQSALKGGELAGDLGWLSREVSKGVQPEVHKAAFALEVNQLSDMVVSKDGVHILLRAA